MDTAKIAEPISGDKLYQVRARQVFPILVRQAEAGTPIYYSDLAKEVEMPNPRNLNFVLSSIGTTLERLSKSWENKESIPPIQCLVINKNTGLPGKGIGWFLNKNIDYSKLDLRQQRAIVTAELHQIFSFKRWRDILAFLSLEPLKTDFSNAVKSAISFGGGGESEDHKTLKNYIANKPSIIDLPKGYSEGLVEYSLASGDILDILFSKNTHLVAVEVKSKISDKADIVRGIFQSIKYKAVLEAMQLANGLPSNVRAILVLGGTLPQDLLELKNVLGVEIMDNIGP